MNIAQVSKTRKTLCTFVSLSLFISSSVFASDFWEHTWLQGDLGVGYQHLSTNLTNEIPKTGVLANGRILGEYRTDSLGYFGLGLGVQETWQNGSTSERQQQFVQRGPIVDFSYFYPVIPKFLTVGVLVRDLLGAGAQFDFTSISNFDQLIMVGPQARFTLAAQNWDWVAGASILYALNGANRTIFEIPLYVGLSIPLSSRTVSPEPTPTPTPSSTPAPIAIEKPRVAVEFDAKLVTFDLGKSTLRPVSQEFLTKVAKILIDQKDNWKSILVTGHTDLSGNAQLNKKLSQSRAKSVMEWLIQKGVPADQLTSKGYGSEKLLPGIPPKSEQHRRVELIFDGVLDGVRINDAFSALKSSQ